METTSKEISPEAFGKCLQLLRGPSDEERFTGLLIVSKIIKADDTTKIKQVLDAIGFNFINRLLTSKPSTSTNIIRLIQNQMQKDFLTNLLHSVSSPHFPPFPSLLPLQTLPPRLPFCSTFSRQGTQH